MDSLKPCPFCGGEARTMEQHRWWVSCQECMCDLGFEGMDENGCYGHYDTEAEAIKAWNTRAERTCRNKAIEINKMTPVEFRTDNLICSNCHETFCADNEGINYPIDWAYCPSCGAMVVK